MEARSATDWQATFSELPAPVNGCPAASAAGLYDAGEGAHLKPQWPAQSPHFLQRRLAPQRQRLDVVHHRRRRQQPRKLKDALRLKFDGGLSHQQIAGALGISKGVVTKYVGLAVAAGLDWQAIAAMDEAALERRLLASPRPGDSYAQADYGRIHQELGRKGVTLMLLWEEYCAQVGDEHSAANPVKPWRYSQFCENYRQFAKRLKRSMRQIHRAGEKLFIDYADPTIALLVNGQEVGRANIFVAAMGVSGYLSSTLPERKWLISLETGSKAQTTKQAWRGLRVSAVPIPKRQTVFSARA